MEFLKKLIYGTNYRVHLVDPCNGRRWTQECRAKSRLGLVMDVLKYDTFIIEKIEEI